MPLFTALLKRAREEAAGIYARNADAAEISGQTPAELRAWQAWVNAHVAFTDHNYQRAGVWLNAAEAALDERPDILCEAEVLALWMDVFDAVDEPRSAFPHARAAWARWFALGSGEQEQKWLPSIQALLDTLAPASAARPTDAELMLEWMLDRLSRQLMHVFKVTVRLHGALGVAEGAHAMVQQMQSWIERNLAHRPEAMRVVLHADVLEDVGNLHDALAEHGPAYDAFTQADTLLSKAIDHPDVSKKRLRIRFNAANALAKLGEHGRAASAFAELRSEFTRLGMNEPALRAQHAELIARWYSGQSDRLSLMAELDELILAYERQPADVHPTVLRQNLDQAYRLWLTLAAPLVEADQHLCHRFLSQLYVLREGGFTPFLTRWSKADPKQFILSEVAVLLERLAQLEDTVLLIVETGVQQILLATVRSGRGPMTERVSVAAGNDELVDALANLLTENSAAVDDIIDRTLPIRSAMDERFAAACRAPWQHLPQELRAQISAARCLILSISNFGDLDALPLELLHDGTQHIALEHEVIRATSLQQLNESLAPNRVHFRPSRSALLVRAADLDGAGKLVHADPEVDEVTTALRKAGIDCRILAAPDGTQFLGALGAGHCLFHYVGHGFADESGEALLLNGQDGVTAIQLLSIGPLPAPICVTSSCLVGRARHLRTGFQRGVVISLLARGAPAVIAATDELPDQLGRQFVSSLYSHALTGTTLSAALLAARRQLAQLAYHPAAWSALVLFGDPRGSIAEQSRELAWPALLLRLAATDSSHYATRAKDAVTLVGNLSPEDTLQVCALIDAYAHHDRDFFANPHLHRSIAVRDVEAYLAYHLVLRAGRARFAGLASSEEENAVSGFIGLYTQAESLLTDSYLTITAALVAWHYLLMHPTRGGQQLLREAGRAFHWLSGDPELQATRELLKEEVAV